MAYLIQVYYDNTIESKERLIKLKDELSKLDKHAQVTFVNLNKENINTIDGKRKYQTIETTVEEVQKIIDDIIVR